jgi:AmmeMemoRadiSam system protein B
MSVRLPAVAGLFYPEDPQELRALLAEYLDAAEEREAIAPPPKAMVVPHAGYIYSGPIAASAYVSLKPAAAQIERVVLLGPAHRVAVSGLAVPSSTAFRTPLGDVPIDREAVARALTLPQVKVNDRAHAPEHSLEVHLPFLQTLLPRFALVPLVVGDAAPAEVGQVLDLLWGGAETLVVVSSDLSHYLDYQSARRIDACTAQAIEKLQIDDVGYEQACGRNPINGLLAVAPAHNLHVETVDLRNSGDTAGDKHRVVGYGSFLFR